MYSWLRISHPPKDRIANAVMEQTTRVSTRTPKDYGLEKLAGMISYGASPRASISLAMASKAYAFIKRRGYVIPEDVRAVCYEVLRHRIGLTYEAEAENITTENIITDIINTVEVP